MKAKQSKPEYPLEIDVKKTWPLRHIKDVFVAIPGEKYGNTIHLDQEQAIYLRDALTTILEPSKAPKRGQQSE